MKANTIYQPFAQLIVSGDKRLETRSRRTLIRGRILVHAAQKDPFQTGQLNEENLPLIQELLQIQKKCQISQLPRGVLIGTVELVDCLPVEELGDLLTAREKLLGDFSAGRHAWILRNPVMWEHPIVMRGKQGWWNCDLENIEKELL